jgi:hypothetical protein
MHINAELETVKIPIKTQILVSILTSKAYRLLYINVTKLYILRTLHLCFHIPQNKQGNFSVQ